MTSPQLPPGRLLPDTDVTVEVLIAFQRFAQESRRVNATQAAALGITRTAFQALIFVSMNDGNNVPELSTPKALADYLEVSPGAVTALVDKLETSGYLVREPHGSDRRSLLLRLTDPGHEAVDGVGRLYWRAVTDAVPAEHLEDARDILNSVSGRLAAIGAPNAEAGIE